MPRPKRICPAGDVFHVLEIEAEGAVTNFADGKRLDVKDRRLTIAMPAESGTILLYTRSSTQRRH